MPREKPTIFISHVHEDQDVATALAKLLDEAFLGFLDVFVASDGASIRAGERWSAAIETALIKADLVLVLLSERALDRRWIYFEAGGAFYAGKRVVPICCRGLDVRRICEPFSWLQTLDGRKPEHALRLLSDIAAYFDVRTPTDAAANLIEIFQRAPHPSPLERQEVAERAPSLLVCMLIDSCGSMVGHWLQAMRQGVTDLVDYLQQPARKELSALLTVLSFGSDAWVVVPPTPIGGVREIPDIHGGGATSLGAGLRLLGRVLADSAAIPPTVEHAIVIIATEGFPTDDWSRGSAAFRRTSLGRAATVIGLTMNRYEIPDLFRTLDSKAVFSVPYEDSLLALREFFHWIGETVSALATKPAVSFADRFPDPPAALQNRLVLYA